jgi:hypothetical protein
MRFVDRIGGMAGVALLTCTVAAWVLIGALREEHSPEVRSVSTENAKMREVFVKSPVVRPSLLQLSDAVAYAVTDAWIEHPTRVRYRWFLIPHQTTDSSFRVVVHLAQVVRDSTLWTRDVGRIYVSGDVVLNGEPVVTTSDPSIHIVYKESSKAFPDTIRLAIRH